MKKGLSGVISVVILIAIVLTVTAIIWVVINKTVEEGLGEAESCYNIAGKVTLNSEYTCYNSVLNKVYFSINIGDIEIKEVLVSISSEDNSKVFTLTNETQIIDGLKNYDGTEEVMIPGKNSGKTYIASDIYFEPVLIQIAPVMGENNCGVADSIAGIPFC